MAAPKKATEDGAEVKKGTLFVTAPLVEVRDEQNKPVRLMAGDIVAENISKESVDNLKSLGYVSESNPLDGTADDEK